MYLTKEMVLVRRYVSFWTCLATLQLSMVTPGGCNPYFENHWSRINCKFENCYNSKILLKTIACLNEERLPVYLLTSAVILKTLVHQSNVFQ